MSEAAGSLDAALKVAEIVGITAGLIGGLGGGGALFYRIGRMSERVEAAITGQADNIAALQTDVRELNKLMTSVAVQQQRLDTHDHRMDMVERLVDDIRRGEGRIWPLERSLKAPKPSGQG